MSAAGKGGFPQGPQIGGGPAPAQPAQQPDIYTRLGGQPNVDSNPNLDGYQPPTASPMPPTQAQPMPSPGMGGGKSGPPGLGGIGGGGKGGMPGGPYVPRPDIGPGVGFGPGLPDPNTPSPLGPEGQQPVTPQPPAGTPTLGGKGGMIGPGRPFNPQDFISTMEYRPGVNFNPTDNNY